MAEVMDAGNGKETNTRDSESHPVVDDEDEVQQHGSNKIYPNLQFGTASGGNAVEISSNGDGGSSKHDHLEMDAEIIRRGTSNEPLHLEVTTDHESSIASGSFKTDSGAGGPVDTQLPTSSESRDHEICDEDGNNNPTGLPIVKTGSSSSSSSSSSPLVPAQNNDNDIDELDSQIHHIPLAIESGVSEENTKPGEQAEIDGEPMTSAILPNQSPPVQVMQRSEGYDPNRIPQSVFQRSSSDAQNDWSIASNESLFSIHVGTSSSFSREQALFISEARKLEENCKSNEVFSFTPHPLGNPDDDNSPNSPTAFPIADLLKPDVVAAVGSGDSPSVAESQNKQIKADKESEIAHAATTAENVKRPAEEQHSTQKKVPTVSWRSTSVSNFSDRSQNSTRSFAFPILSDEARLESAKRPESREQNQETAQQKKAKRRWYSFLCCPWKKCCFSCRSYFSCRSCFSCPRCSRCWRC